LYNDPDIKAKLKQKYGDEQVFVIPHMILSGINDKFTHVDHFHGIWNKFDTAGRYILRYDAEMNPEFQQLIPYILVQDPINKKFFVAERIAGEPRLIGRISLGFGGHINPCDGTKDVLFKALYRELNEELYIEPTSAAKFVGYVKDMTSTTNDHTGCVFVVQATVASIKEKENLKGEWVSIKELEDSYFKFEGWAKYVIDYLSIHKEF
jgi:predicted NUDIX family phosphoesterase